MFDNRFNFSADDYSLYRRFFLVDNVIGKEATGKDCFCVI